MTLMEVSMNLKKRATGAVAVAMSVVVMTSVAQAAPADYKTGVAAQTTAVISRISCRRRGR